MPFTTIVTARDVSHDDGAASALAATLAAPASARVVTVDTGGAAPSGFGADSGFSSARTLRRVVAAEGAELLVLGARERERVGGTTSALWTLHGAPCAIAVAPAGAPREPRLRRIGIGVDTGPDGRVAVALAYDLARRTGATLQLLAVVDDGLPAWIAPLAGDASISEGLVQRRLAVALELLSELMEGLDQVHVDGKLLVGNPALQLARASDGLDLLVLGSRRSGPADRLALGTTSERLLRDTSVPLLVAPRGEQDRSAARPLPVRALHAIA